MANDLTGKYYIRFTAGGKSQDVTTRYSGLRILAISGFAQKGEAINVYNEQWVNSETEDFMIAGSSIKRKNVNIEVTFIVSSRYSSGIDPYEVYQSFIDDMTQKEVWLTSQYANKDLHCVSLESFEPTTVKLNRGNNGYILGKIKMHLLEPPQQP